MIPTASSLYMRQPATVPYNYGGQTYYNGGSYSAVGPQPYYVQSPSSYQMSQQIRLPGIQRVGSQSPMVSNSPTQPLTSHSAVVNDDTPVTTRRFNAYKENRDLGGQSMLNTSSATLRPHMSSASVQSALPADFGHMLKQAVAEAVRAEKSPIASGPLDLKQVEEVILREREERKVLKAQLKAEKKQVEQLTERVKDAEKIRSELDTCKLEMKRLDRDSSSKSNEIDILQSELSELRNEKIIAEQLDEEHSAKMKVYTQDLMATSLKYQQDIQSLINKNEKLGKEVEVLKAKNAELDRQSAHTEQVKEALNRKIVSKDSEIASLQSQIDKLVREKKQLAQTEQPKPYNAKQTPVVDTSAFENRIRELEAVVAAQKEQMAEQENRKDDAFGILRSAKSLTPARRVSHLTSRREAQSYAPMATSDWLEPLAIADHVLSGVGVPN